VLDRLLRQPGGLQGIGGVVEEGLEAKQLAASDLKENPDWLFERDAAPPAVERTWPSAATQSPASRQSSIAIVHSSNCSSISRR
jgi:hypothetical protein